MENNEKLRQTIKEFKDGIKKQNQKKYEKLNSILDDDSIPTAINLAYNDAKRTMSGIGNPELQRKKDEAIREIEKELRKYFLHPIPPVSESDFDEKHKVLCEIWHNKFSDSDIGTYGKAQKIINMSFKYLYCCEDALTTYKQYFQYCHMPLDSFTLEWFKREFSMDDNNTKIYWFENEKDKKLKAGKIASWSALEDDTRGYYRAKDGKEYYSYRFFIENIRRHIRNLGDVRTPLEIEFFEWPKIQMTLAAEGFLFGLEGDLSTAEKRKIQKEPLKKKYDRIMEVLKKKSEMVKELDK